jgi:hypothetical protein
MGKQVRIKGHQSVFGSHIYMDGHDFLPLNSSFLDKFKIPNAFSVSRTIKFSGYLISHRLINLLGPGYYSSEEIESKQLKDSYGSNRYIYVEFQVTKILYFGVNGYFFNTLSYFDIAVEIDFAEVRLLEEKHPYPEYGNHVEININHGCGVYSTPLKLKEHQIKIRKDFPGFQSIESVVHLDLPNSLEHTYSHDQLKEWHPSKILCFLKTSDPDGVSYNRSEIFNLVKNHISKMEMVHFHLKVYITDKSEIINKITKGKLINPENLDSNGIVMLIRENKTYDKDFGDYVYSYRVISNETEILKLVQR